jgi:hypothetical protein
MAGFAASQSIPVALYQSWLSQGGKVCEAPRAQLNPIQTNARGEAVYAIPLDANLAPGTYAITVADGQIAAFFTVSAPRGQDLPIEPSVPDSIRRRACAWNFAVQAAAQRQPAPRSIRGR